MHAGGDHTMIADQLGPAGRVLVICELLLDVAQEVKTANEVSNPLDSTIVVQYQINDQHLI